MLELFRGVFSHTVPLVQSQLNASSISVSKHNSFVIKVSVQLSSIRGFYFGCEFCGLFKKYFSPFYWDCLGTRDYNSSLKTEKEKDHSLREVSNAILGTAQKKTPTLIFSGYASTVCSGQQSRRTNASETGRKNRPEQACYTGDCSKLQSLPLICGKCLVAVNNNDVVIVRWRKI